MTLAIAQLLRELFRDVINYLEHNPPKHDPYWTQERDLLLMKLRQADETLPVFIGLLDSPRPRKKTDPRDVGMITVRWVDEIRDQPDQVFVKMGVNEPLSLDPEVWADNLINVYRSWLYHRVPGPVGRQHERELRNIALDLFTTVIRLATERERERLLSEATDDDLQEYDDHVTTITRHDRRIENLETALDVALDRVRELQSTDAGRPSNDRLLAENERLRKVRSALTRALDLRTGDGGLTRGAVDGLETIWKESHLPGEMML